MWLWWCRYGVNSIWNIMSVCVRVHLMSLVKQNKLSWKHKVGISSPNEFNMWQTAVCLKNLPSVSSLTRLIFNLFLGEKQYLGTRQVWEWEVGKKLKSHMKLQRCWFSVCSRNVAHVLVTYIWDGPSCSTEVTDCSFPLIFTGEEGDCTTDWQMDGQEM